MSYIVWRDLRMTHDASMAWKAEQPLLSSAILLRLLHAFYDTSATNIVLSTTQ